MLGIEVGKEFPMPEKITTDGGILELDSRWMMAVITCTGLSSAEISSFSNDPFKIALVDFDDVFFLVCKTGETGWWEIPYSASIYPYDVKQCILSENGIMYPLFFVLVENFTKTVMAIRSVQLNPEFSDQIKQVVDKQILRDLSWNKYRNIICKWCQELQTPEEFLLHASAQYETASRVDGDDSSYVIVL